MGSEYNDHWDALSARGVGALNDGFCKRWIQGSVGMNSPMPLYSNEYSFLFMKHGQNDPLPYRGNLALFDKYVTTELKQQVNQCSRQTLNPVGCQLAAIQQVFSASDKALHPADRTVHPYDVSYKTGYNPFWQYIAPNDPNQD